MDILALVTTYLSPVIEAAAGKYGIVVQLLSVIGVLRIVNKPLFALLQDVANATKTSKDNEILKKIIESKIYKGFSWLADYLGSIKLPK